MNLDLRQLERCAAEVREMNLVEHVRGARRADRNRSHRYFDDDWNRRLRRVREAELRCECGRDERDRPAPPAARRCQAAAHSLTTPAGCLPFKPLVIAPPEPS